MKLKEKNAGSIKTRNLIKKSFAELLEKNKEINNISVTELTKQANISRGSFYTHYDSIYDVAQEMEDELQEIAFSGLKKVSSYEDYLDIIFDYLKSNEDLYTKLLKSNDPILFMNRLSKKFFNALKEVIQADDDKYIDLKITFYTEGAVILLIKYFRKEIDYSLDEIKNYLKDAYVKIL